jgi:hypothetical protein
VDLFSSTGGESRDPRVFRWIVLILSAALAAAALRFAWHEPLAAGILAGFALLVVSFRWASRRRVRRMLHSGDVHDVLRSWSPALERIPYPATMGPLMTATAFAAYGWLDEARASLAAAERGPAWDAAIEHRLFLDTLLLTFEGERDAALEQARRLGRLPLPPSSPALRERVRMLRLAIGAFARAFAHRSELGDDDLLVRASESSPLVFWAMRYAAAVVAIDRGNMVRVRELLMGAPVWPEESIFKTFHLEIEARARVGVAS